VRERVAHEQVTEFIVNAGNGDWQKGEGEKANSDYGEEQDDDGEALAFRESGKELLDAEEIVGGSRVDQSDCAEYDCENSGDYNDDERL
jgi:hypothetical protein